MPLAIGLMLGIGLGSDGGIFAPAGMVLLLGADGAYLKGADGAFLCGRA